MSTPDDTYVFGTYTIDVFTAAGAFEWEIPGGVTSVDVLVVAGGGSGGKANGAGGGAGGVIWQTGYAVAANVSGSVGTGGAAFTSTGTVRGNDGQNSVFGTLTAIGGGGGGCWEGQAGKTGGSGGGGGGGGASNGGAGTAGQGNDGGQGIAGSGNAPGGGGGAGAVGGDAAVSDVAGDGGAGVDRSAELGTTYGVSGLFGGGGGGDDTTAGAGGSGGGGAGGGGGNGVSGIANTGGGGGGHRSSSTGNTGAGGSGIVMVRYETPSPNVTETAEGIALLLGDADDTMGTGVVVENAEGLQLLLGDASDVAGTQAEETAEGIALLLGDASEGIGLLETAEGIALLLGDATEAQTGNVTEAITEALTLNVGHAPALSVPILEALELGTDFDVPALSAAILEILGLSVIFSAPQKFLVDQTMALQLNARYVATAAIYAELLADLNLGETVEDAQKTLAGVIEGLELHDTVQTNTTVTLSAVYGLALSDTWRLAVAAEVEDGAVFGDALAVNVNYWLSIAESLNLDIGLVDALVAYAAVDEGLALSDAHAINTVMGVVLDEGIVLHVGLTLDGAYYYGHTLNAEGSYPESDISGWTFNSLFTLNHTTYGINDTGIYALTGDTDAGTAIEMDVLTGQIDIGQGLLSRVDSAQLGYASDGTVYLAARVVTQGIVHEHWYELVTLPADAPRDGVVDIGKGLKSLYWQFRLKNVDGASLQLDALRLYPVILSRRRFS